MEAIGRNLQLTGASRYNRKKRHSTYGHLGPAERELQVAALQEK
ncbi:MAG: hypothetical protein AAGU11_11175 [Syntrophobacteraceae bacterium]